MSIFNFRKKEDHVDEVDSSIRGKEILDENDSKVSESKMDKETRFSFLGRLKLNKKTALDKAEGKISSNLDSSGLEVIKTGSNLDISFDGERILQIGRKKVIIGMLWDAARDDEKISDQAESLSNPNASFDLFANLKEVSQFGFAEAGNFVKPGLKVGVTSFNKKQMGETWLAAFQIGKTEFYWIVAQRDGAVYEDQVLTGEDEARMVFFESLEAPGWQRTIAPESWEIGGVESYDLIDTIDTHSGISLKAINPFKTYLPRIIAISVLTTSSIIGWVTYQNWLVEQERRAEELERQRRNIVRVSPSDYPWFDTPTFELFIDACLPEMEEMIRVVPGWHQDTISCLFNENDKHASIKTSWANSGGTLPWMIASFDPSEVGPTFMNGGTFASLIKPHEFNVQTETLTEAWESSRIEKVLSRRIQTANVAVSTVQRVERITPAQQTELREPVFNYHDLNFITSAGIREYALLFSDIPALVPNSIIYDLNSKIWSVTFRIYHPAILPLGA